MCPEMYATMRQMSGNENKTTSLGRLPGPIKRNKRCQGGGRERDMLSTGSI
jgi:hypothetical protein